MAFKHVFAAIAVAAALSPAAFADPFRVKLNQTVTLKLASAAESVVIGNAGIADVSVHDPNTLLVTGKAFGTTNLLVLDHSGREVYSSMIAVAGSLEPTQLTIYRGVGTNTYSCIDKCRPTPTVGDTAGFVNETQATANAVNGAAKGDGR